MFTFSFYRKYSFNSKTYDEALVEKGAIFWMWITALFGMALAFARAWVPEYMKVPVLFVSVIAVFAVTDSVFVGHHQGTFNNWTD